jgi:hypothetical protein
MFLQGAMLDRHPFTRRLLLFYDASSTRYLSVLAILLHSSLLTLPFRVVSIV